ncbi:serine threonine kinase with TRP [Brachionus plicatilis]|uniref:Serine threonine kinase with TRP n=1 Tax=Brachionus plicatilis TaxID=10195 RepID=A0A3M7T4H9_BRAPC|nr:serine threonine kinase with TRP [Brachionus plicatilis]
MKTNPIGTRPQAKSDNVFEIAARAEKLLKEILSSNKPANLLNTVVKNEPVQEPEPSPRPSSTPQQPLASHAPQSSPHHPHNYYYHQGQAAPTPGHHIYANAAYYVTNPPPVIPYYYQPVQPPQTVYYQSYQSNVYRAPVYSQPRPSYIKSAPVLYQPKRRVDADAPGDECDTEQDLNIMRERELKDLKCKSVLEKMNVFIKYYKQFCELYMQRVHMLECGDSLKIQFGSLIRHLNEYDMVLDELNSIIVEHERGFVCKNNHRKTKKLFNKSKAFIRYECSKRLQANIFEYRRLINSQDRYAGMYDLLDMNNHLISLIPEIGVSIRRYINKCERAREVDADEDEQWNSECSNDENSSCEKAAANDVDLSIPSFNEFCRNHEDKMEKESGDCQPAVQAASSKSFRNHESYSKGIDALNRYLLKRVDQEESLDELVKERIVKWINKRQAKYILIFSEVDKLLNQHKAGECYPKFHSYLLFNLGKLVTVCESYHQKLKELLYSTTIRRKKKRKKVKILPEAMTDVFGEINDLKKSLEYGKVLIKKCNNDFKLATPVESNATE